MSKQKIYKRILQGLFFLALFSPLVVDRRIFFPYVTTSALFFRFVVEVLLGLWIVYALLESVIPSEAEESVMRKRSKFNFLIPAVIFYLFALTLATIFSANPYLSFWGDAERMMGLFSILHFFALFFVGINIFETKNELKLLLNSFVVVSVIMCVYGILQKFGFTTIKPNIDRIVATVGNSGIFAGYLVFGLFFSIYANIREWESESTRMKNANQRDLKSGATRIGLRVFYGLSVFLHLAAIFLTGTRGAYLGVICGLAVVMSVIIVKLKNKKLKYGILLAGLFCVLIYGVLFINQNKDFVKNNSYLYRITHFSLNDATLQMRLMSWKWGIEGFKEKPLLGYGLEQYAVPFDKNFEAKYYDYSPSVTYFDRAHNIVIELLATTGIIGLIAYIILLASLIYFIIKMDGEDKLYKAVFIGLVIAYFIQNLFIFDLLPQMLGFMVLLVFVNNSFAGCENNSGQHVSDGTQNDAYSKRDRSAIYEIFILIIIIILGYGFVYSSKELIIKPYKALKDNVAGQIYFSIKKQEKGVEALKQSLSYKTFLDLDLRSAVANTILDYYVTTGAEDKNKKDNIDYAISLYKEDLKYLPDDAYYNYKMAELLNFRFSIDLDEKIIDEANFYINKAIAISPENIRTYYLLSENMLMAGKLDDAVKVAEKAVEMNKNFNESYWELTKTAYIVQDFDKAKENLIKTIDMGYKIGAENMEGFAYLFDVGKSVENATEYYELLIKNGTSNPLHYTTLANYLLQVGEKEKAITYALKAAELDPKFKDQVDKFVKQANKVE